MPYILCRIATIPIGVLMMLLQPLFAQAGEQVAEMAAKAKEEAKRWQKDAVLVEIHAKAGPDGTIERAKFQTAMFMFVSPSTNQEVSVASGVTVPGAPTKPFTLTAPHPTRRTSIVALPDRFLDLSKAVEEIRKQGVNFPQVTAFLKAEVNVAGQAPRAAWTFAGRRDLLIDAGTGGVTTMAEVTGEAQLPPLTDYAAMRKVADARAASDYREGKLYEVILNVENRPVGKEGRATGRAPHITAARFLYAGPSREMGIVIKEPNIVKVQPGQTFYGPGGVARRENWPNPVPSNIKGPEPLLRLVAEDNTWFATGSHPRAVPKTTLYLMKPQAAAGRSHDGEFCQQISSQTTHVICGPLIEFFKQTAPADQWIWWMVRHHDLPPASIRVGADGKVIPTPGAYQFANADATTGKVAQQCADYIRMQGHFEWVSKPCPESASAGRQATGKQTAAEGRDKGKTDNPLGKSLSSVGDVLRKGIPGFGGR